MGFGYHVECHALDETVLPAYRFPLRLTKEYDIIVATNR